MLTLSLVCISEVDSSFIERSLGYAISLLFTFIISMCSFSFGHCILNCIFIGMETLIPVVSKLQDVFATLGRREDHIHLPQIVVVGSQVGLYTAIIYLFSERR